MTTLAEELVPDELWALVEPLLLARPRPPYGGRHRAIPDRNCFAAIVYMTRTSTPWRLLPVQELGCGSPSTCWRRLTEWANAGVFDQLHLEVLDRLGEQGRLDWSRASVDALSARAPNAGDDVGVNPVDRGKPGSKLHLVCDGQGVSLAAAVTAANLNDSLVFEAVLDDVPAARTPSGQRRCRPNKVHADKGYDARHCRTYLQRRGITARRGVESSQRLRQHRWRVERSLSWLSWFRRLQVRWDRGSGRWFGFVLLACALICFNRFQRRSARTADPAAGLPRARAPARRLG